MIIAFFFSACNLKNVIKSHGTHSLETKEKKIFVNRTNKNDLIKILGPPSTKESFDNELWIYIERKTINSNSITKFGKKKILLNNVLVLEIDKKGLLVKKELFDTNKMNNLNFSENTTGNNFSKQSYLSKLFSSMRQKINDPLGKRKK